MQYHASSACYNTPRVPEYDTPSARATQVVMGEILSTEQQLTETQRGLERLPRQRDSKDKNLQDQLQALGVQVQDAENEMVRERERGLESGWKRETETETETQMEAEAEKKNMYAWSYQDTYLKCMYRTPWTRPRALCRRCRRLCAEQSSSRRRRWARGGGASRQTSTSSFSFTCSTRLLSSCCCVTRCRS